MKYVGRLWEEKSGGRTVVIVDEKGHEKPLPLYLKLYNHSPNGFAWGYGGSGPAQLSLAIVRDYLERVDDGWVVLLKDRQRLPNHSLDSHPPTLEDISWRDWLAIRLYQQFKWAVIAQLPQNEGFTLTFKSVEAMIEEISHR